MRIFKLWLSLGLLVGLVGCFGGEQNYAPVTDVSMVEPIPKKGMVRVRPGDTLYSIAWRYGMDYRTLARQNQLVTPYAIHSGQIIFLNKLIKPGLIVKNNVNPLKKQELASIEREPIAAVNQWQWPARGTVSATFTSLNKGINIAGNLGDPIYATAAGRVVYCGNGLRRYGNLIIIKHNSTYLSAYAHNSRVFVKEGSWVKSGQKIAAMGNTGTKQVILHFEIRRNGQSVNPLVYLSGQN